MGGGGEEMLWWEFDGKPSGTGFRYAVVMNEKWRTQPHIETS